MLHRFFTVEAVHWMTDTTNTHVLFFSLPKMFSSVCYREKIIHLKVVWMIIPAQTQTTDPAAQQFDTTLRRGSGSVCGGGGMNGIPLTFRIGEHKGRIDLMSKKKKKKKIVAGRCHSSRRVSLAHFLHPLI